MTGVIGLWSHALAALLYGMLAIWQLRNWNADERNRPLVAAFAVTSLWGIFMALLGPREMLSGLAECARNLAFLSFMYAVARGASGDQVPTVRPVYFTVAGVIGLQIVVAGVLPRFEQNEIVYDALLTTANILGFTTAAGALVLVHNLYGQAAPNSRWGIRLPAIALAGMWAYDLHLYTVAYLTREVAFELYAMRGAVIAMLVPLFALASRRNPDWRIQISRAATFQSVSVMVILAYLILMMSATQALEVIGGRWVQTAQIGLISAMSLAAIVFLPSAKARAWLRVMLAKHFFEHRYDYRQEWLRFTRTIGLGGADAAPIGERVIKAMADVCGAPAGLLLLVDGPHRLIPAARWNWHHATGHSDGGDGAFIRYLETSSHVIDFNGGAVGPMEKSIERAEAPTWIDPGDAAWAGVPLLHNDRLVGLVVLAHPPVRRPLDWEDFDLFRTAGIQAASYLAEAQVQDALADSQRFDEFNRRFAFILHDIKNLVSQLSLLARNAERHAENPAFRADMIMTLQSSVKKMNDLLARLTRDGRGDPPRLSAVPLRQLLDGVAQQRKRMHPIEVAGDPLIQGIADAQQLEQALAHLLQNAIDASPADQSIHLRCAAAPGGEQVMVEVSDSGRGMSADFVSRRLFQPFASTKESGFGIGAFEARTLIETMGGRIEVASRPDHGTCFTIILPAAQARDETSPERMRA